MRSLWTYNATTAVKLKAQRQVCPWHQPLGAFSFECQDGDMYLALRPYCGGAHHTGPGVRIISLRRIQSYEGYNHTMGTGLGTGYGNGCGNSPATGSKILLYLRSLLRNLTFILGSRSVADQVTVINSVDGIFLAWYVARDLVIIPDNYSTPLTCNTRAMRSQVNFCQATVV